RTTPARPRRTPPARRESEPRTRPAARAHPRPRTTGRRAVTAPGGRAETRSLRRATVGDDAPRPKPLRHRPGRTAGRGPAVGPVAGGPPDPHAGRRPRDPPPDRKSTR